MITEEDDACEGCNVRRGITVSDLGGLWLCGVCAIGPERPCPPELEPETELNFDE